MPPLSFLMSAKGVRTRRKGREAPKCGDCPLFVTASSFLCGEDAPDPEDGGEILPVRHIVNADQMAETSSFRP